MIIRFPKREDGPPKGAWAPAKPASGLSSRDGETFKFSVRTEDGVTHRFLLTREGAQWLADAFRDALADHRLPGVQSFMSSERPVKKTRGAPCVLR